MKLVAAVTVFSALAAGVNAAPLDLGGPLLGVGLNLGGLNPCLFANLATLTLNSNTALNVGSNTCISIDDCLSVKTREVVRKPALAGVLQIGFCQTKTCPAPQILNSAGVCVNPTVSTPKPEPTKACATGRILNAQGVCVCAPGTIFANSKKETCISTANCDLKFNTATDGVCLRKVCADGKLLSSQLGLCIDASLCALRADRLCKEVKCPANKTLDSKTGLCVSVCTNGLLLTPNKQCITVAACSPLLNTVSDGACIPKACKSNLLTINNNGICVCLPGFTLNKAGTCVLANLLK